MTLHITALENNAYHLQIGKSHSVLVNPAGENPLSLFPQLSKPDYILLTSDVVLTPSTVATIKELGARVICNDSIETQLQNNNSTTPIIKMGYEQQLDFPWAGDLMIAGSTGALTMTHCSKSEENGFILEAYGHKLYFSGPMQLTQELREIGLNYRPNVSFLTLGQNTLHPEQIAQAVMWLGSDIVFPSSVCEPGADPIDMAEVYATIDIYTPAICRMLAQGESYALQPTESSGRLAGPEARY